MNIGGVEIGGNNPCRIVAEIGNAHNGTAISMAYELIDCAERAGADIVKFQCYTVDELVELRGDGPAPEPWGAQGWTMRTLYEKAQTPHQWFPDLAQYCIELGIPWFSSVFGKSSLDLLQSLDCPAYKLAALDEGKLRKLALATGKPVIESVRRYNVRRRPVPLLEPHVGQWTLGPLYALYCPPGYPQPHINFQELKRAPYLGLSYHGTDPTMPAIAVAFGAKMIEVHVQLDDVPCELEANVALTMSQLGDLHDMVRRIEAIQRVA